MSRIGKAIINIPEGVEINIAEDNIVSVKGKLGERIQKINGDLKISINEGVLSVERPSESKEHKSLHGLSRALIANMVTGVTEGYVIEQELVGVGYRAALKGNQLNLQLGFSHDINFDIPEGIKIVVEKQTIIKISGSDKQQVGTVISKIKSFRKPEPYKGKGIREQGQHILRKEGKKK